jgi:pyrroline-5-carboxylate reductase
MTDKIEIKPGYTVGVLGCGTMGTAVLNAMLETKAKTQDHDKSSIIPGRFLAAVNSEASAKRLTDAYGDKVELFLQKNNDLVKQSDMIILGCKPFMLDKIVGDIPHDLFKGKIVVSLLAGKTIAQLEDYTGDHAVIARAMTNTPSKIGHGMTVVSFPQHGVTDSVRNSINWIFENTGRCLFLEEKHQDVATALCGSGPAFSYLFMEAMCDGAVRMGMPYPLAQECAAQVLKGAAEMVHQEGHPAVLRSKVCTPAGTTIGGLMVMEDNKVRSAVARSIEESTNIATALGKK